MCTYAYKSTLSFSKLTNQIENTFLSDIRLEIILLTYLLTLLGLCGTHLHKAGQNSSAFESVLHEYYFSYSGHSVG